MPTYLIRAMDKPEHVHVRAKTRPIHLEHLAAVSDQIIAAGAVLDDDGETPIGSVLIVELPSLTDAQRFLRADPYSQAGLFAHIEIRGIRMVHP